MPIPSDSHVPGDTGHVSDHNAIADVLTALTAATAGETTRAEGAEAGLMSRLTQAAVLTASGTAAANTIVPVNTTSGNVTVTLPSAPPGGTLVAVKQIIQGGSNTVTIACAGTDVLDKAGGSTSSTLTLASQGKLLQYGGGIWVNLADDLPLTQLDARYANLASPALTGTPTAPTASALTGGTQLATTTYADSAVAVETARRQGPNPSGDTTGATDSAALIAAAASVGSWSTINLPSGRYYINQTVLCSNLTGVVFMGQGKYGQTRVTPVGTGMFGVSMFKFVNCWSCGVENMWIDGTGNTTWTPLAAVESQANSPGGSNGSSTNLNVKDCFIGGTSSNSMTYGIAWTLVTDSNNDEGYIANVDMQNIKTSCYYIGHLNSLQHKIIGGSVGGSSGCAMITLAGGSFSCFGTAFAGPSWIVDFGAGTYTHSSLLVGAQTEGPTQWFRSNTAATVDLYVAGSYSDAGAASTTCIDWEGAGMLSVSSCRLLTGQTGTLAQFTNAAGNAVFTGCTLGISTYSWQNNLAFQTCHHTPGTVTLTQLSGANPVYQPNDTGGGFSPAIPAVIQTAITTETNRAEAAEAALAGGTVTAALANNASGGTSGTTVTTGNSGGASGNAFNTVSGTVTFDNAQAVAPSSLSYKMVAAAGTAYVLYNWPGSVASGATMYLRTYVQFSGSLFATYVLAEAGGTHYVEFNGTHWTAKATPGTTVTGVTTPVAGAWYRIEAQFIYSSTAGATIARIYNFAGTLLETITATGGTFTGAPNFYFGGASSVFTGTMWLANIEVSNGGWVGPAFTTDQTATDIQPLGTQAAGALGIPADAGHVHAIGHTATASLAFTSSIANGASASLTMTVTGAATGAVVDLGVPATFNAGLIAYGFVSAASTVTVVIANLSGAAVTPGTISVTAEVH